MAPDSGEGEGDLPRTPPWAVNSLANVSQELHRWPRIKARLWWLLVASFFTLMTSLAIVLTVLWHHDHNRTMDRMQEVYVSTVDNFNSSVNREATEIVKRMQGQLVRRIRERIQEYLRVPELIVKSNMNSVKHDLGLFKVTNVSRTMDVLWVQLEESLRVSGNAYADDSGVYVGYERRKLKGLVVAYRPPNAFATSPLVCPICPPLPELRPGEKGFWTADNSTGRFGELIRSNPYIPRSRPWYRLAVEANGVRAWTKPYVYSNGIDIGVDCVQAYMVGGRPRMIFDASISLRFMTEFLTSVHRDLHQTEYQFKNSVTFIVDAGGHMIASSRGLDQVIVNSADDPLRRRTWRELSGYSVRAALERLNLNSTGLQLPLPTSDLFPDATPGTDYPSVTIMAEGGPYLCAYGTLAFPKVGMGNSAIDWIIVSIVRKEVYMLPLSETLTNVKTQVNQMREHVDQQLSHDVRRTTFIGFAYTLLGGALMACVARAITMPIRRISKDMRSIAELKFMDVEPEAPWSEDEVAVDFARRRRHAKLRTTDSAVAESSDDENVDSSEDTGDTSSLDSEVETSKRRYRWCPSFHMIPVTELVEMRRAFASMSSGLQSFAKYVDPHVVELLVRGRAQARLGVEKADVTIFFSDIANFTTMGETLDPEQFMDLLSEYLEEMSSIIMQTKGVVGEYIGDGIMAWWNTPRNIGERHTVQALTAALDQQRRLAKLRRVWCARGLPEVHARMGLARGTVLAGNVGSHRRMKFGLVGDSVNLASRLEALCKRYGVSMLVDASVHDAPGVADSFLFRPLDLVVVKGRSGTTELFEPVAPEAEAGASPGGQRSFVEDFARIQALYRAGDFRGALSALEPYQRRWPNDKPARMVWDRCKALLANPPGPGWTPVETLSEK